MARTETKAVHRAASPNADTARKRPVDNPRVESVLRAARASGLMGEKSTRLGGRFSPALVDEAKRQTGIETDTDLLEFALANLALSDDFAARFRKLDATVDPDLDLDF